MPFKTRFRSAGLALALTLLVAGRVSAQDAAARGEPDAGAVPGSDTAESAETPRAKAPPPAERSKEKQPDVDAVALNPAKGVCVLTKDLKPLSPRPKLALVLSGGGARGA